MSRLHEIKIAAIAGTKPAIQHSTASPRAGTRTTRTRAKTARALGHNYTPTQGWRDRSQGVEAGKQKRKNAIRDLKQQVKRIEKGDAKKV